MKKSDQIDTRPQAKLALGALDHILNFRMRRIRDHLAKSFRQAATEGHGLRAGDFTVLALIEANPRVSQIDLSRVAGYDQANLVSILDDLERHGWVIREKDTRDRRRHCLLITEQGRLHLHALSAQAIENEFRARAALDSDELVAFEKSLRKIYRSLLEDQ